MPARKFVGRQLMFMMISHDMANEDDALCLAYVSSVKLAALTKLTCLSLIVPLIVLVNADRVDASGIGKTTAKGTRTGRRKSTAQVQGQILELEKGKHLQAVKESGGPSVVLSQNQNRLRVQMGYI
ncbi:hypothetical protein EZV62_005755 [Acer yangbiense]|uniref:Uncharacterized protein n=1 Tax=Acer yangbiense TaxID=1000413 RepID=A0A5C7INK7_9ROSI|nr:hypothetical protein EZV62_005755 [Acer yangbiense]